MWSKLQKMGIEVLYGSGSMKLEKYGVWKKSSIKTFGDYVNALSGSTKQYDVLINDGRCKPQVAYYMRSHLKKNGIMIVRGGSSPSKSYYSVMSSYYSVIAKCEMAGR